MLVRVGWLVVVLCLLLCLINWFVVCLLIVLFVLDYFNFGCLCLVCLFGVAVGCVLCGAVYVSWR